MNTSLKVLIPLLAGVFVSGAAQARWANMDDADYVTEKVNDHFEIRADGTYEEEIEVRSLVLKENARTQIGTMRYSYSPKVSDAKIIEAKTINDGKESRLDDKYITDKPITMSQSGFDDYNQLSCAFNEVRIGSSVDWKVKFSLKKTAIKGLFAQREFLGFDAPLKSGEFTYTSHLPIYISVNDPDKALEVQTRIEDGLYRISVKTNSTIFKRIMNEKDALLNINKRTWFVVSSSKSYGDIAKALTDQYEQILGAELPSVFDDIYQHALAKKDPADRINTATSELAQIMRYVGDWRDVDGGHVPRSLNEIAKTMFGDCKDFSAVTTAILRKLKMNANVAFVERGAIATPLPDLVFPAFNHAIVNVTLSDNRVLWIDPTNMTSFATGIFEDIIDRPSLVIRKNETGLLQIPKGNAADTATIVNTNFIVHANDTVQENVRATYQGRSSAPFTGLGLRESNQSIEHNFIEGFAKYDDIFHSKMQPVDLSSRIVSNFEINFSVDRKSHFIDTSLGAGLHLTPVTIVYNILGLQTNDRISDYFIKYPVTIKNEVAFTNIFPLGKKVNDCSITSPWIKADRQSENIDGGILVKDRLSVEKAIITNEELQSPEFLKLRTSLKQCFENKYVIFKAKKEKIPGWDSGKNAGNQL